MDDELHKALSGIDTDPDKLRTQYIFGFVLLRSCKRIRS